MVHPTFRSAGAVYAGQLGVTLQCQNLLTIVLTALVLQAHHAEQSNAMCTKLRKSIQGHLTDSPTESQMMLLTIPPNSLAPTDGGLVCDCRPCTSLRKTRNSVIEVASLSKDSPSSKTRKWWGPPPVNTWQQWSDCFREVTTQISFGPA